LSISSRSFASAKEEKLALKQKRRELYEASQKRMQKLQTRRNDRDVGKRKSHFREWFDKRRIFQEIMDRKARQLNLDWTIQSAAILERLPVVTPDMHQWEIDYYNMKAYLEQFGKEYPDEIGFSPGKGPVYMTEEEILEMLPEGFTPAPRVTQADETGNRKTLDRRLKSRVYLAVKDTDNKWILPTATVKEDETLLDATKRAVSDAAGNELVLYCPSNCPMAVDMTVYSEENQKKLGVYGIKTFFMRVQYDEGKVNEEDNNGGDYGWFDRDEMTERVREERGEHASKLYHYML
jgi:large subunit ribosomal protein L46